MTKIKILSLLLMTCLMACQSPQDRIVLVELTEATKQAIAKEIDALTDDESQKIFLENIYNLDQKIRHDNSAIEEEFGRDSEEAKKHRAYYRYTDDENLEKIEQFLTKYGHPTIERHGSFASGAPWIVIHHAHWMAARERNFKYLYEAYKKGDIDDGNLTFYLNRWYDNKFKYRIEWNRPYRAQEEIDTLLKSLELVDIAAEIDKKFKPKP